MPLVGLMMYIVPTAGTTGSCVERGGQRRGRLHKNVCGIPQGRGLLLSFLSLGTVAECSLPLSFAPAAFVVSFIIPLICCAPARDHHNRSRMYFFCLVFHSHSKFMWVCVFVYKLCVSFSAVECPIQVPASYSLLPSFVLSLALSLAASFRTHSASCARL